MITINDNHRPYDHNDDDDHKEDDHNDQVMMTMIR